MRRIVLIAAVLFGCSAASAQQMDVSVAAQEYFLNRDGSCVQCSNSLWSSFRGDFSGATLLFDTEYGPGEHGGSGPARVAKYCRERNIPIYNITGRNFEEIAPALKWAARTGRFGGVGCFSRHFQTFWGIDADGNWLVQNNWPGTFGKPYVYNDSEMKKAVEASGAWCVIPKGPPPAPNPIYRDWYTEK